MGDDTSGRTVLSIIEPSGEKRTIIDVTGWTHHPEMMEGTAHAPDGFKDINPITIYLGGQLTCALSGPMVIDWDSFAIGGR